MLSATVESMTIGESLLLSLVSMGTIMAVLLLIMGLIYLMSYLYREFTKRKKAKSGMPESATVAEPAAAQPAAPGSCGELTLVKCSERDAAMIMAIVANNMQEDLNRLRFRSIKLVDDSDNK